MDEATANLDLENESDVLTDLFANISPEAIVLMVTHRKPGDVAFTHTFDLQDGCIRARNAAHTV
jgi:ABC-type transport system involved in cytochrome bd biosynthesis fused ATPase/permease subunit